ncbi:MAG: L,D-transpeptidase [Pseudobdellovibrionaceae bacterium]
MKKVNARLIPILSLFSICASVAHAQNIAISAGNQQANPGISADSATTLIAGSTLFTNPRISGKLLTANTITAKSACYYLGGTFVGYKSAGVSYNEDSLRYNVATKGFVVESFQYVIGSLSCSFPTQRGSNGSTYSDLTRSRLELAKLFPVVVYVNKAERGPYAQLIYVFKNGNLAWYDRVSTGREQAEKPTGVDASGKKFGPYFSSTPEGFYTVKSLSLMHKSNLWDAEMPYSIFFNDGIALHQVPAASASLLGRRASGGCVRVSSALAPRLYGLVKDTGLGPVPQFSKQGLLPRNPDGQILWQSKQGYQVLVIVDDDPSARPSYCIS